jgi:hypothetical protein
MNLLKTLLITVMIFGCSRLPDGSSSMAKIGAVRSEQLSTPQGIAQFDADFGPRSWSDTVRVFRYRSGDAYLFVYNEKGKNPRCVYAHAGGVYLVADLKETPGQSKVRINEKTFEVYSEEEWGKRTR